MKHKSSSSRSSSSNRMNKDIESAQSLDIVDNKQQLLLAEAGNNNNNNNILLGQHQQQQQRKATNGHQHEETEEDDEQQKFNTTTTSANNNNNKQNKLNLKSTMMTSFNCFNSNNNNNITDDNENKGKRWFLLLSMTTVLIITAILIAMLTISMLDNEDQCFNSYLPFQQPSYKLFSTKTSYSTTYNLLNQSLPGSQGGSILNGASSVTSSGGIGGGGGGGIVGIVGLQNNNNYDYSNSVELPNIFSKSDSLRTLHERLVSKEAGFGYGCKVRQLHYFGRHAARYPSNEDVEFIIKQLISVQNRIDLSKFSLNNNNNNPTTTTTTTTNNNNNKSTNNGTSPTNVCFNPLAQFKQWVSFMSPEQGNLIMDSGLEETTNIAQRFKSIYPEMFDSELAKIELGTTNELRTAQTALAFLKQINNFKMGVCNDNLESFEPTTPPQPQPIVSPSPAAAATAAASISSDESIAQDPSIISNQNGNKIQRALELKGNQCYRQLMKKYHLDKLEFHKKCQSHYKEKLPLPYNLNLNEPNRTKFITNSVSKKLKLSKEDSLTPDETQAIYKICKYESALVGQSIWCNLFSDSDLKFYEYLSDVDDFFNQAYGHPDQMRSACPVTTDLMKAFKRVSAQQQPEAHFYFTHSEVIQKILAASVDLENDPDFSLKSIQSHLHEGTTPESRQWRTSLYTPFSANLAFTLYECSRFSQNNNKPFENSGGYQLFDVSESPFKVVASLNEQPIQLDGCSGHICDLNELVKDSRIDREKRCKLEDICKVNRVYT